MKHTPLPWCFEEPLGPEQLWIVEEGKQAHEWSCIAIVLGDDPESVQSEDWNPECLPICGPEQRANAEFIVRACNSYYGLLEALSETQRMFGFMKSVIQSGESWSPVCQESYDAACAKIDAALNKARGTDD